MIDVDAMAKILTSWGLSELAYRTLASAHGHDIVHCNCDGCRVYRRAAIEKNKELSNV